MRQVRSRQTRQRPPRPRPFDHADLELEAQLETELALRRAERHAGTARTRAQRAALRRFLLATLVLIALVAGVGYLIFVAFGQLFGGN